MSGRPGPDDHTLRSVLARLQSGEDDMEVAREIDLVFRKYLRWLRYKCAKELREFDEADVEEAVQETLLNAWRRLPDYTASGRFRNWLWGIAHNVCRNVRRKRRDAVTEDGLVEVQSEAATALAALLREERDEVVRAAAEAVLDAEQQELVELRYVHEYSREQVAEITGLADADEVRKGLVRCRRRLEPELARRLAELSRSPGLKEP